MNQSLINGASGIRSQVERMDVIANNISNLNSIGFKKSSTSFKDVFYQKAKRPGMPATEKAVSGSGVQVSGIEKDFSQGAIVPTGRQFDLAINGRGYFAVQLPNGETAFSRDGSFRLDASGDLVNAQGFRVVQPVTVPGECTSVIVGGSGQIEAEFSDGHVEELGQVSLYAVPNPSGMEALGRGLFRESAASGPITEAIPGDPGVGEIVQGALEQSNVDLGHEMVEMISAQRALQLNAQAVKTADEMWALANELRR